MIVLALLSWWYGTGWAQAARRVSDRVGAVLRAFSIGTLARTLFAPFRQISAGQVQGPANVQFQAFLDRLFSRFVGAFMRSMMIIFGLLTTVVVGLVSLIQLLLWPLVPLLPVVGLLFALTGWTL